MANILDYNNLLTAGKATPQNIQKLFPGYYQATAPAPVSRPAPTPQPQQQQVPSTNNQPAPQFQVPSGPSDEEINAIYAPIEAGYAQDEQNVTDAYNQGLGLLDSAMENVNKSLTRQKTTRDTEDTQAKNTLQQGYDSAYSQATKAYNALKQQAMARFGGSSSAGQGMGELAAQSFFQSQGQLGQTHENNLAQLIASRQKFNDFLAEQEDEARLQDKQQRSKLLIDYNNNLTTIKKNREMTHAEKLAKILDIKTQYNADKVALANQLALSQQGIRDYAAKIDIALAAQEKLIKAQQYQVPQNTYAGNVDMPSFGNYSTQSSGTPIAYNPFYRKTEDEFDNPYFS